jgi:hypothetical protein
LKEVVKENGSAYHVVFFQCQADSLYQHSTETSSYFFCCACAPRESGRHGNIRMSTSALKTYLRENYIAERWRVVVSFSQLCSIPAILDPPFEKCYQPYALTTIYQQILGYNKRSWNSIYISLAGQQWGLKDDPCMNATMRCCIKMYSSVLFSTDGVLFLCSSFFNRWCAFFMSSIAHLK